MANNKASEQLNNIAKFFRDLIKDFPQLSKVIWGHEAEFIMKHTTNDSDRGKLMRTFQKYKVDLTKFLNDTSRLPKRNKPVNNNEVTKGARDFVIAENNRMQIELEVDDPRKVTRDFLNDTQLKFLVEWVRERLKRARLI